MHKGEMVDGRYTPPLNGITTTFPVPLPSPVTCWVVAPNTTFFWQLSLVIDPPSIPGSLKMHNWPIFRTPMGVAP